MRNTVSEPVTCTEYLQLQQRSYWIELQVPYRPKTVISLTTILQKDGNAFVDTLYEQILGRPPDKHGRSHHMQLLESGVLKQDIIRSLLQSNEAQARDIQLDQPIDSLERHPRQDTFSLRIKRIIRQFIPDL
jgi:hypothetical protein